MVVLATLCCPTKYCLLWLSKMTDKNLRSHQIMALRYIVIHLKLLSVKFGWVQWANDSLKLDLDVRLVEMHGTESGSSDSDGSEWFSGSSESDQNSHRNRIFFLPYTCNTSTLLFYQQQHLSYLNIDLNKESCIAFLARFSSYHSSCLGQCVMLCMVR